MKKMTIQELTTYLKEEFGLSQPKIGELLGVSPLMVHHYQKGKVVSPNPQVAFAVWKNIELDGEKVLLDIFDSEDQLMQALKFHEKE